MVGGDKSVVIFSGVDNRTSRFCTTNNSRRSNCQVGMHVERDLFRLDRPGPLAATRGLRSGRGSNCPDLARG